MVKVIYYGVIHKDPDSDYGISFPDFPGCVSAGDTVEEAVSLGKEALLFHIEGMVEDKEPIPEASKPDEFASEYSDAIAIVPVEVSIPTVKVKRYNIAAREDQMRKIDNYLKLHGRSRDRSEFLIQAALDKITTNKDTHVH